MRRSSHSDNSKRLDRWLEEWDLDQILCNGLERKEHPLPTLPQECTAAAKPIEAGEIRLLQPTCGGGSNERPLYFVVLDKLPDGTFLIAPFGRFSEPALPGEWLTGLKAMPLRVLCLWNSRVVGSAVLSASWRAGRMTPEKVRKAVEVHRHIKANTPLTSVSPKDIGPPVKHPLDPRLQYQIEEENLLEENLTAIQRHRPSAIYDMEGDELRLAAESQEPYGGRLQTKKRKTKC